MINRPENLWIGGDWVQMLRTAEELVKLGVEVEISETPTIQPAIRMREFDIVHSFNFSMLWNKYATFVANGWKKPLVCSMIYHESDQFVSYADQQTMLDNTDACIYLADGELERVKRHLTVKDDRTFFVPNGIDEFWFSKVKSKKKTDEFVLTVGRLDGTKGQLETAQACKELGIKYVCVGDIHDKTYADAVASFGAELAGRMGKEDLIKMYSACKVMALPSTAEVMSLVAMEAMAQNANIVMTDHSEWKPDGVSYCKPGNVRSIKSAIKKEWNKPKDPNKYKIVEKYSWAEVAKQIKQIYEQTIDKYSRGGV